MSNTIKKYITELDVQFISLVKKGANKRTLIYKSATGAPAHEHVVRVLKVDEEKQLIYCTVYAPDEADSHNEAMTAVEIEKAAHKFLAAGRTAQVDKQHDEKADEGYVVESFILNGADERFPDEKEGSWVVAIKVEDASTWEEVKKGDITGVSFGGLCVKVEAETQPATKSESFITRLTNRVVEAFKGLPVAENIRKDFNDRLKFDAVRRAVWALNDELSSIVYNDDIADKKSAIQVTVGQFLTYLADLETDIQKSFKTEVMSAEATKPAPEAGTNSVDELKALVTKQAETIQQLSSRLEEVEKAAPGRQSQEGRETTTQKQATKGLPIFG